MNESTLFLIAFILYIVAAFFYFAYLFSNKDNLAKSGYTFAFVGLIVHSAALILRAIESGHAPFTNMYESLSFLAWSAIFAYMLIEGKFKIKRAGPYFMLIVIGLMALASSPLMPKEATPLVADSKEKKGVVSKSSMTAEKLDSISYRTFAIGFPLFTLGGLVFGMVWAYKAWGRYWSWDPKETWSLITWFVFALYLHTRIVMGWKGRRSALIAIIGFLAALFTYFGVNYLLAGLHSYA
jgi:ABC-type transport system involved in cytochrome c biogenesis permease subunit